MPNDPDIPDIRNPAAKIAPVGLAFGSRGGDATFVDPLHPLPVEQKFPAAGSTPLAGSTSSTAVLGPFTPALGRPIWLTLSGTWAGNAQLKRSDDAGASRHALTAGGEAWAAFTGNCCEIVAEESDAGASYYLDFTHVSGTLTYRVAQ